MKISIELSKKLKGVSISLSEKDKEDPFFSLRDPNVLIDLAKYAQRSGNKINNLNDLKRLYDQDLAIRKVLFSLIQNIEDKLTGTIIQKIAYVYPDYHLQSKNFELNKYKSKSGDSHFLTVNKFILDLRRLHHDAARRLNHKPLAGYVRLDEMISTVSLGIKAKLVKYSKYEQKVNILSSFNVSKDTEQINSAIDFLVNLNSLRNRVMHQNAVIGWEWKPNSKKLNVFEFIKIAVYFTGSNNITKEFNQIPELKNFKGINKEQMLLMIK